MSDNKIKVSLYTDGACSGNPGIGGYGAILVFVDSQGVKHEKEFSQGYKMTTNNQMEILGVVVGLEALKKPCDVTVYMLLTRLITNGLMVGLLKIGKRQAILQ